MIQEAYVQGISTRSVDELVKAMGMSGIAKSQASRLCEEIDQRVKAFPNRPLEGEWPYLRIDATYVKTRQAGRIVSDAAIIAVAVNTDGRRSIPAASTRCRPVLQPVEVHNAKRFSFKHFFRWHGTCSGS